MSTIKEKIDFQKAKLEDLKADAAEITEKSEDGSFTEEQSAELEAIEEQKTAVRKNIQLLESQLEESRQKAKAVKGNSPEEAAASRSKEYAAMEASRTKPMTPPGIGFARAVKCIANAKMNGGDAVSYANEVYKDDPRIAAFVKAAVPAAVTSTPAWAGDLANPQDLASEFLEYLQPIRS